MSAGHSESRGEALNQHRTLTWPAGIWCRSKVSVPDGGWDWVKSTAGEESGEREHTLLEYTQHSHGYHPNLGYHPDKRVDELIRKVTGQVSWSHSWILGGLARVSGIFPSSGLFTWHQNWPSSFSWRFLWKRMSNPVPSAWDYHSGPHLCCSGGSTLSALPLLSELQADVAGQLGIVSNNQGAALKGSGVECLASYAGLPEEAIWTGEICLQPWQENFVLFELCLKPQSGWSFCLNFP